MPAITEEEKLRRSRVVESVLGTNAMEGIVLDATTLMLARRFEEGEIEIEQLSSLIDKHIAHLDLSRRPVTISQGKSIDAA